MGDDTRLGPAGGIEFHSLTDANRKVLAIENPSSLDHPAVRPGVGWRASRRSRREQSRFPSRGRGALGGSLGGGVGR